MRKILYIISVLILCLIFSSCHGQKYIDPFVMPEEFDDSRQYNISFWAKNDSNPTQRAIYEKAITEFEKIYTNINVEIRHYASYPDLYRSILQNVGTNTTPNVAIAYPDHVATYLENPRLVVKLEDVIEHSKYGLGGSEVKFNSPKKEDMIKEYLEEGYIYIDGNVGLYTLPFMRSTECLYVNKTWLEEHNFSIPNNNIFSWDYIWEICEKAIELDPNMIPLIYKSSDNFFIQLAHQNGYDFTTEDGKILFYNDNNVNMVKKLNKLYKKGLFVTWQNTGFYPGDKFNIGKTIFGVDSSAGATWMGPKSPLGQVSEMDFEVLVTTIPQVDVNNPKVISQGPSLCVFNKEDNQEVLASWLFLQFLLTNEVQIDYIKTEGYAPVTYTAINSREFNQFINSDEIYSVQRDAILNVLEYKSKAFVTPAFTGSALVRDNVGTIIDKATISKKKEIDIESLFKKALLDSGA